MMPIRCTICLEVVSTQTGELAALKCGHVFHDKCVRDWLNTSLTCPKCRTDVPNISKSLIHLFMDTDCGDGSFDASGGCDEFRPSASEFFAMKEKMSQELHRQEELATSASLKYRAAANQLGQLQEANIKLTADLEKKKLKQEIDAEMKRQLREQNKDLRSAARVSKSEATKMRAEIMTARRNLIRTEVCFENIRKEFMGFTTKVDQHLTMLNDKKRTPSIAEAAASETPKRKNSTAEDAIALPKKRIHKRKT